MNEKHTMTGMRSSVCQPLEPRDGAIAGAGSRLMQKRGSLTHAPGRSSCRPGDNRPGDPAAGCVCILEAVEGTPFLRRRRLGSTGVVAGEGEAIYLAPAGMSRHEALESARLLAALLGIEHYAVCWRGTRTHWSVPPEESAALREPPAGRATPRGPAVHPSAAGPDF